jgi:hypothetical protein
MNDFLYLYRGGTTTGTPEQMQNRMQKWMTWMKELGDKGHIKDIGHPLEQSGKVVKAHKAVTDGPFAEAKDLIAKLTPFQGWIGAIVTYVAVIGLIALLIGIAQRGGWSLKKYLRVRFLTIFASMALLGLSGASYCDTTLTACSNPFF